jgi:energy-coupling factor transporter transmembrane protein EcfT
VLAVALGAVPGVLAEGRRIEAVTRLRRGNAARERGPRRWWRRAVDRSHLAVPLLEGLFRRADGLSLALLDRRPRPAATWRPLPASQLLGLAAWGAGLLLLALT